MVVMLGLVGCTPKAEPFLPPVAAPTPPPTYDISEPVPRIRGYRTLESADVRLQPRGLQQYSMLMGTDLDASCDLNGDGANEIVTLMLLPGPKGSIPDTAVLVFEGPPSPWRAPTAYTYRDVHSRPSGVGCAEDRIAAGGSDRVGILAWEPGTGTVPATEFEVAVLDNYLYDELTLEEDGAPQAVWSYSVWPVSLDVDTPGWLVGLDRRWEPNASGVSLGLYVEEPVGEVTTNDYVGILRSPPNVVTPGWELDNFGARPPRAQPGDYNGDGITDYCMPFKELDTVYVVYGPVVGERFLPEQADATILPRPDLGIGNVARCGTAGDLDGDGVDELVVATGGGISVFYDPPMGEVDITDAEHTYTYLASESALTMFGSAGDYDGDGFDDLIVGSYFLDEFFLFYGPITSHPQGILELQQDVVAQATFKSPTVLDRINAGDVNGDGVDDLLFTSIYETNPEGSSGAGSISIFYGGTDLLEIPPKR